MRALAGGEEAARRAKHRVLDVGFTAGALYLAAALVYGGTHGRAACDSHTNYRPGLPGGLSRRKPREILPPAPSRFFHIVIVGRPGAFRRALMARR